MSYGCKCQCANFREHVGYGPIVSASSMPTRKVPVIQHENLIRKEEAEGEAYVRLHRQGYSLPNLKDADVIEKHATHEIELKHGRLYGETLAPAVAETMGEA